jgi:hypothetical protein
MVALVLDESPEKGMMRHRNRRSSPAHAAKWVYEHRI